MRTDKQNALLHGTVLKPRSYRSSQMHKASLWVSLYHHLLFFSCPRWIDCQLPIMQGYRYLGHRDNRWLSTSGDVPIRVVILCSVYAVPWVSWCDAVERRGTVLVVWIFFTSTIACLGVISTPDRSRSTHFAIVSGNACFGQLSTEMFSFITSSASCSRSRRTSGRNQPSTKD